MNRLDGFLAAANGTVDDCEILAKRVRETLETHGTCWVYN